MIGPLPDAPLDMADRRAASLAARKRPTPRRRPETEIVGETISHIRAQPRGYAHKVHGGAMGHLGEPDVDGCLRGRALKAEAKAMGKRPTPIQMAAMRRWADTGALVWWFTALEHTVAVLDHVDEPRFVPDLSRPGCDCSRHREA